MDITINNMPGDKLKHQINKREEAVENLETPVCATASVQVTAREGAECSVLFYSPLKYSWHCL